MIKARSNPRCVLDVVMSAPAARVHVNSQLVSHLDYDRRFLGEVAK